MILKLKWSINPAHYRVWIFVGKDDESLVNCGMLTFLKEEARVFRQTLEFGFGGSDPFLLGEGTFEEVVEEGWRE